MFGTTYRYLEHALRNCVTWRTGTKNAIPVVMINAASWRIGTGKDRQEFKKVTDAANGNRSAAVVLGPSRREQEFGGAALFID